MSRVQRLRAVAWPAFVVAGLIEMLVFAFVDPRELHGLGGAPLALPAPAVYTLAFLGFWALVSLAASIALLLAQRPDEVNAPPAGDGAR